MSCGQLASEERPNAQGRPTVYLRADRGAPYPKGEGWYVRLLEGAEKALGFKATATGIKVDDLTFLLNEKERRRLLKKPKPD
ncbi:MAG: hypothetical protein LBR80_15055 [Deltaproteobacteria bacterium]|nr:hypothetical protein [Deltaproteobacteria bacterium]